MLRGSAILRTRDALPASEVDARRERGAEALAALRRLADAFDELRDLEFLYRLEGAIRGVAWEEIPRLDLDAMRADASTALDMGEF